MAAHLHRIRREEPTRGQVIAILQALEVVAVKGGTDARVQLVEQVGEVEGRIDPGEGVRKERPASTRRWPLLVRRLKQLSSTGEFRALQLRKGTTMSSSFNFDAIRREVEKEAQSALNDKARQMTREFDGLRRQYEGQPIETIKPALRRAFSRDGGSITEPELTGYAEAIRDGVRIEFNRRSRQALNSETGGSPPRMVITSTRRLLPWTTDLLRRALPLGLAFGDDAPRPAHS